MQLFNFFYSPKSKDFKIALLFLGSLLSILPLCKLSNSQLFFPVVTYIWLWPYLPFGIILILVGIYLFVSETHEKNKVPKSIPVASEDEQNKLLQDRIHGILQHDVKTGNNGILSFEDKNIWFEILHPKGYIPLCWLSDFILRTKKKLTIFEKCSDNKDLMCKIILLGEFETDYRQKIAQLIEDAVCRKIEVNFYSLAEKRFIQ